MASREVHVGAIGDGGMSGGCRWWTHGVALVRFWDPGHESMRNKWKTEYGQLYCINGADYGHGSGLEAGLCKLNRQEQRRRLQERMETASGADRDGFRSGRR
jgi:hypothetical protein